MVRRKVLPKKERRGNSVDRALLKREEDRQHVDRELRVSVEEAGARGTAEDATPTSTEGEELAIADAAPIVRDAGPDQQPQFAVSFTEMTQRARRDVARRRVPLAGIVTSSRGGQSPADETQENHHLRRRHVAGEDSMSGARCVSSNRPRWLLRRLRLLLRHLFHAWERYLAVRDDPERRVLPFDWGTAFLGDGTLSGLEARAFLHRHVDEALADTDAYFSPAPVADFQLAEGELTFTSPLATAYPENNRAHATFFPAADGGPAVLVLPQWNAKGGSQTGLCRLLNRFGMTALRVTLPYHGPRTPAGLVRADYMLSPNLGRTLQACRQAVWEARSAATWLASRGYGPLGIVGTSLGSAIAFIALAHDRQLRAGVLNHVSPYFADVVWKGISTRHVRQGLEEGIELEELRRIWMPISPRAHYERLLDYRRDLLLISARYDLSFLPEDSRRVVESFQELGITHQKVVLPCGHYTTGTFPFNWMDGLAISRFLAESLRGSSQAPTVGDGQK